MTYCVAMTVDEGLVFLSDTRTNAGVDHISTARKMSVFEQPGERMLVLDRMLTLGFATPSARATCRSRKPCCTSCPSRAMRRSPRCGTHLPWPTPPA